MPGYDGDPIATEAAFLRGWFKTGDLGFFDTDGYLFLTGRSREIINRGGEKITPKEIDEALLQHPAVAEAVTFAVPHPTLGEDIGSAVVLRSPGTATPEELRQFVTGRVSEFKVPRQVLIVEKIPKGATGKVRRVGLAAELGLTSRLGRAEAFVPPRTSLERSLAERWAEILKVERVGIHDDFFALGGDSLLVAHVLAHAQDTTHVAMTASRFFETPTIAETASHLEKLVQAGEAGGLSRIAPVPRRGSLPASFAQERLWKLQRAVRGMPFFNVFLPLRLTSACDAAVLQRSIDEIVQRHEILRTTFAEHGGQCVQVVAPQSSVRVIFDDLHALPPGKKKSLRQSIIQEEALYAFDLARGPMFRARLVRLAKREHLLLITMHGIIVDGWSVGIFVEELCTVYGAFSVGASSPLASLSIQYADFAHWQRHWQSNPEIAAQLAYWQEQLRGPLPLVRQRRLAPLAGVDSFRTLRRELRMPASLTKAAKRFGLQQGGTLYMVLVAALKTMLQRQLGQDDVRVATLVANRNRSGTESLIGPLANTVVLRTNLGGDPKLVEIMRRVRASTLAAFAHQDLPFEELIETLERDRAPDALVPAQVMISLHNATLRPRMFQNALIFEEVSPGTGGPLASPTIFDVCLMLREGTRGIDGSCIYKPRVFDPKTIDRMLLDFHRVLQKMVTQPERPLSRIGISK
jgi:hypothetical protein